MKRVITLLFPVFASLAAVIYSVTPASAAPPYPCATRWQRHGEELYEANDRYGSAIALGDLNGDGRADVAVGAPTASHEPSSNMASGKVYVYQCH
jgi:hypothetical protein